MTSQAAGPSKGRQKGRGAKNRDAYHEEESFDRTYDFSMLLRVWPFVRPHRGYLVASLILLVVMSAAGLIQPLVMREALASFETSGATELTKFGLILGGMIFVEQLLGFPQLYWIQYLGAHSMAALRSHVFGFLHGRSLSFFDRTPIGRLVTRVTNDVDAMNEMFASGAINAIGDLIKLVGIVVIMLSLDWSMSLFAFVALPPVALLVNWTRKRMRRAYREVRAKTARMNAFINEQVSGIGVVQAYAREAKSEEEFDVINASYREANMRAIVLDATLDASIEMVGSICIATVLWYAGFRPEGLDFPTLFAFVAYLNRFFMPLRNLSQRYTQIQSAFAGAERVFRLLESVDEDARLEEGSDRHDDWPEAEGPAFAFRGVSFGYKPEQRVLHDIELVAERGETIAIVGPTGSGKTTIVSLLLRLYEIEEGRLEVFGRDVRSLDRLELRRQFAVVPQDVFLFPGTVASNVAAGAEDVDHERVRDSLAKVGALEMLHGRPDGIETEVRERGSNFSAGERQLIALARALYRDPLLLILDEPTASIDSDTEARLQRAMDAAMEGRTSIIIAHRLSTIRNASRILCLHRGRIVEQGTHDELLEADGIYARLYRLQATREAIEERVVALQPGAE